MTSDAGPILVGDVGGTNVRFAMAAVGGDRVEISRTWKRSGDAFPTFEAAVLGYLEWSGARPAGAAFGLAGAVVEGQVRMLHRDWSADRSALAELLGVERVVVVNDFQAMARAAPELGAADADDIAPGLADPSGSIVVTGPGTGFGVAVLRQLMSVEDRRHCWIVLGGEGGHQAFAPQTAIEWELALNLRRQFGYVSNEMVASGSGFEATLRALAAVMGLACPHLTPEAVIERAGRGDALCLEMCRLRARTVMTSAGDTALLSNATGGVFLGGGVSLRIAPWLTEREALDRFYARGVRSELMSAIPVKLITADTAPLIGAAWLWLDERERGWL
ncbi:MAG: glucokinase [Alphaproteobacteria bacterium]|nr:glucokinase [Alphaproteobacteria bacterium]